MNIRLILVLIATFCLCQCATLTPPADPNRSFILQFEYTVNQKITADSVDVCITIDKGRVKDHFILETVTNCYRIKPGDSKKDILTAFGFLGDPQKRKVSVAEIVTLPLKIRVKHQDVELWEKELAVESYSSITLPARGLIPLNDLGVIGSKVD